MTDDFPTTENGIELPANWSTVDDGSGHAWARYVYVVDEAKRVYVGLKSHAFRGDAADFQLRVASVDDAAVLERQEFVAGTYEDRTTGVEKMESFMRLVADALPDAVGQDQPLSVTIRRCIEDFETTPVSWRSFFGGR